MLGMESGDSEQWSIAFCLVTYWEGSVNWKHAYKLGVAWTKGLHRDSTPCKHEVGRFLERDSLFFAGLWSNWIVQLCSCCRKTRESKTSPRGFTRKWRQHLMPLRTATALVAIGCIDFGNDFLPNLASSLTHRHWTVLLCTNTMLTVNSIGCRLLIISVLWTDCINRK